MNLQAYLPDREIYVRTNGRVSFFRISSRVQFVSLLGAAGLATFTVAVIAWATIANVIIAKKNDQLIEHARSLRDGEQRIEQYRASVASFATELAVRQRRLETLVQKHFGALNQKSKESAPPTATNREVPPEAAALAQIERKQIKFIRAFAGKVGERSIWSEEALREVGLRVPDAGRRLSVGGPFEPVDSPEEYINALEISLNRFNIIRQVLIATPSRLPTLPAILTSSFGLRSDPFVSRPAFHRGLDVRGRFGQPVYAAADGRIVRVGQMEGYGNVVIINHGYGLQTLYGHLSRFERMPGAVKSGEIIARIGSSGRSTGPHLHFEVRVNGIPVNPLPFLSNAKRIERAKKAMSSTRMRSASAGDQI